MIAVIRIHGRVGLNRDINETLNRMGIMQKYACVVIPDTKVNLGMVKKVANFVAFGEIDDGTFKELIEKRGKSIGNKKIDASKVVEEIKKGKKYSEVGLKKFFRLHPARKGIDAKKHFGETKKAVLGNNKDKINDLIRRML